MEIKGKVHCMFEQSGTFKKEFIRLGIPAEDYDIKNDFGETDHQIDIFREIEKAYHGARSIFDNITSKDLVIAFFPCIYFATEQSMFFMLCNYCLRNATQKRKIEYAINRAHQRHKFYILLWKLIYVCEVHKLRLIIENPAKQPSFLLGGVNFPSPSIIDHDRTRRGDYYKKPTAYWFFNCCPTSGQSFSKPTFHKVIEKSRSSKIAGQCSVERSSISQDYARNFIHDFILGKRQDYTIPTLFDGLDI